MFLYCVLFSSNIKMSVTLLINHKMATFVWQIATGQAEGEELSRVWPRVWLHILFENEKGELGLMSYWALFQTLKSSLVSFLCCKKAGPPQAGARTTYSVRNIPVTPHAIDLQKIQTNTKQWVKVSTHHSDFTTQEVHKPQEISLRQIHGSRLLTLASRLVLNAEMLQNCSTCWSPTLLTSHSFQPKGPVPSRKSVLSWIQLETWLKGSTGDSLLLFTCSCLSLVCLIHSVLFAGLLQGL